MTTTDQGNRRGIEDQSGLGKRLIAVVIGREVQASTFILPG
jgi:hypothetical protein